ncbi:MAG TPA: hypothetical protein VGD40_14030 [Chryseosolibacter sp.]
MANLFVNNENANAMTCLNCSTKTIGKYCHECGQKTEDVRYTMRGLVKDLFYSTVHFENKGLPITIVRMTTAPGRAIHAVLQGQRQSLYPPLKYLALVGAIVIICSLRYRFFHNEYTQVNSNQHKVAGLIYIPEKYEAFVENFFKFAEDNATILNIAAIPIFAFFSFVWLSGKKYNFAENLVLNTFITAQQLVFLLLLVPFYEFLPGSKTVLITIYTVAVILYNIWVYLQFFGFNAGMVARSAMVVFIAYLYQFPLNFLIFYIYERYVRYDFHWIPEVYNKLVG